MAPNPFRRKPKPKHRTSAQHIATPSVPLSIENMHAKLDDWQVKLLKYASIVPEVMTGYLFVHNTMDRLSFQIEVYDKHENAWIVDETPQMSGVSRKVNRGFQAGRAMALQHLVEEAYILVNRTRDNQLHFETLAPTEIKSDGKRKLEKLVYAQSKETWVKIEDDVTVIRSYTPDPANRNQAGGPHKALLGLLELMALELTAEQAEAINVLAGNGILYMPVEIFPDESYDLDASETPGSRSHFESRFEESMIETVDNRSKGEAVVPIVIYGPAEHAKDIVHILPKRQDTSTEQGERMNRYISRYAHAIDLPDQVILGTGDSNHWSDWKVDENTWAYHLYPRAQRLADSLYEGVVKQIIVNLGHDPMDYRLAPDATQAMAKTDISKTAIEVYKTGALKPEALIEATGFDAGDMRPDAEEALLATLRDAGDSSALNPSAPDRTAASSNPRVILRQAGRVANQHEAKLRSIMRKALSRIVADAARDGARVDRLIGKVASATTDKTAAEIPYDKASGYDPRAYFAKYRDDLELSTLEELFAYLRRIATLTGMDYHDLSSIWETEFQDRARSVAQEAEKVAQAMSKTSFDKSKPSRITDATIRSLTSIANGGSSESNGRAGNTSRPEHAGQDPVMKEALSSTVGEYATQYTWVYGNPGTRIHPYPQHEALAGRKWFSWEEFDALDKGGFDPVTMGSVYFPGDHDGCQCEYSIDFVPMTEARGGE